MNKEQSEKSKKIQNKNAKDGSRKLHSHYYQQ